jgi:hypothetical protein
VADDDDLIAARGLGDLDQVFGKNIVALFPVRPPPVSAWPPAA